MQSSYATNLPFRKNLQNCFLGRIAPRIRNPRAFYLQICAGERRQSSKESRERTTGSSDGGEEEEEEEEEEERVSVGRQSLNILEEEEDG